MADERFPEGMFRPDGQPNIPSQAYADYLNDFNPLGVPVADPVGYDINQLGGPTLPPLADSGVDVAPPVEKSFLRGLVTNNNEKPWDNYAIDEARDYINSARESFENALTGQGVATLLPEMRFFPYGPTGAEKIYGGAADAGLGLFSTIVAGLAGTVGFVAEQVPFQNENSEDRLSRDLLAMLEFGEQYAAPYSGFFSMVGAAAKASKAATAANRLPIPEVNVAAAVPDDTPQFGALAAHQQRANAVDADFIPFEDIRIDTTQPMDIVQTTPEEIPQGEILFSPSLRAARELKQEKGSYEQIRAMMIKNGAKTDELQWSGADDMFSGKKVTKEEIIDYLEQNDPRLVPNISKADGVLGYVEEMDGREAVDQVMEDRPWEISNLIYDEQDHLEDMLYDDSDYFSPTELGDEELERLAVEMGTNSDDLRGNQWAYRDDDGNIEFFNSSDDALAHQFGGEDSRNEELERIVRSRLEDEFRNDPPNFMSRYRVNDLDTGDTTQSVHFPEGGTDYTESLFQYTDPTGRIKIDTLAKSGHFGEDNAGTIFHTRHADYVNEDGDTVRYVGEIQSDPQQKITESDAITSYGQSLQEEEMSALRYDIKLIEYDAVKKQEGVFTSQMDEFELNKLMDEASIFRLNQNLKNPNSYSARRASALGVEGEIPFSGEMTDAQETLLNEYNRARYGNPYHGASWVLRKDAQDKVYEYLVGSEVSWVPEGVKKSIFDIADDTANRQQGLQKNLIELETKAYAGDVAQGNKTLKPGGPFMSSQNKWLDEGLRRSIYDAVKDPDVDYLAFPNDPEAIAKVGGRTADSVKEGTVNYYQRDVQNRLKKLLKSFSKDINVEEIDLQSDNFGIFSSKGFKITPEFRKAVMEKGIPTYAVPLAVSTGAGYGALDQVGGENG